MSSAYDHRGRPTYKGMIGPLTLLEDLGEIDYDALLEKLIERIAPLLEKKNYYPRQYAKLILARFISRGLVDTRKELGIVYHVLTKKGEARLAQLRLKSFRRSTEVWDGKWRFPSLRWILDSYLVSNAAKGNATCHPRPRLNDERI